MLMIYFCVLNVLVHSKGSFFYRNRCCFHWLNLTYVSEALSTWTEDYRMGKKTKKNPGKKGGKREDPVKAEIQVNGGTIDLVQLKKAGVEINVLSNKENFRWSSPEKGENFTDSASSTPEFMFEFTDPSLRGEVNSNMNLGVLELKLHEVHFADKFSGAELARRRRTCLQSAPSAVSTPMSTRR